MARAAREAPGVRLRFAPKPDKDVRPLREGLIDLDLGVLGPAAGPEVRVQAIYRDHFVGAVRPGHPLLQDGPLTPERYAACGHIVASRRGHGAGPVDDALAARGLSRTVAAMVPSFRAALSIAAVTDLVALVPASFFAHLGGQSETLVSLPCRSAPSPSSSPKCGTPGWSGTRATAGCAAWCWRCAVRRRPLELLMAPAPASCTMAGSVHARGPQPGSSTMATAHTQQDSSQHSHKTLADLGDAWLAWQIALLKGNRLPLSGDVTQWIKTWGEIVGQVGLVNYNIAGSGDPLAEQRIGTQFSYGRQLGKILDALVPFLEAHRAEFAQSPEHLKALDQLVTMTREIKVLKRNSVEDVVKQVQRWKGAEDLQARIQKLREALDALDEA